MDADVIILNYNHWELDYLVDFIIKNHHDYSRKFLVSINNDFEKLTAVYQEKPSDLNKVSKVFHQLTMDMTANMIEEEQILFPYIRSQVQVKKGNVPRSLPHTSVLARLNVVNMQHNVIKENVEYIRRSTNHYALENDACPSRKLLYQSLNEFDTDLQQHLHLENKILFPRALELERDYPEKLIHSKKHKPETLLLKDYIDTL